MPSYITDRGIVWIPEPHTVVTDVKIAGNSVLSDLFGGKCVLACTDEVGNFELEIDNNNDAYTGSYTGGEIIQIYYDYSDASNLMFTGFIEKISNPFGMISGNVIKLTGPQIAGKLLEIMVTESYVNTKIEDMLEDIVNTYADILGFSYDKSTYPCSTTRGLNWSSKPFWECVIDLCKLASYDCYVSNTVDGNGKYPLVFFAKNSVLCTTEAVVWHDNLIDVKGLNIDVYSVKNKVQVIGDDGTGLPILYTSQDSASQSNYYLKEKPIQDSDIITSSEAEARANAELAFLKETETEGEVKSFLLWRLNPGEKLWISNPAQRIHDTHRIVKITHDIFSDTSICIVQKARKIPHIFKERMEKDLTQEIIVNPYKMQYSYNFKFDDDTNITHSNTETSEGKLVLTSGSTMGTCTSATKIAASNITQIHLKIIGQDYGASTFKISVDDGVSWETIILDSLHNAIGTGNRLRWKVTLKSNSSNPKPEIDSLAELFI